MRVIRRVVVAFASFVILPATVYAQSSLAGFVKDTSGGVLPGVSVEASSPVADREGANRRSPIQPGSTEFPICLPGSTR